MSVPIFSPPLEMRLAGGGAGFDVAPRPYGRAGVDANHRDAVLNGTDHLTEIAADAVSFVDDEVRLAVDRDAVDALMGRILARDVAFVAVDTEVLIDARDDLVVEVQIVPIDELRDRSSR
jgi:hypothetical protein